MEGSGARLLSGACTRGFDGVVCPCWPATREPQLPWLASADSALLTGINPSRRCHKETAGGKTAFLSLGRLGVPLSRSSVQQVDCSSVAPSSLPLWCSSSRRLSFCLCRTALRCLFLHLSLSKVSQLGRCRHSHDARFSRLRISTVEVSGSQRGESTHSR